MKYLYLVLAIIGFVVPNVFVFRETMETGNFLLWLEPKETLKGMFTTNISSAFISDLLWVVLVFFIWSYQQAMRYRIKNVYLVWILTMLFGMACSFPLFLYMREQRRHKRSGSGGTKTRRMSASDLDHEED